MCMNHQLGDCVFTEEPLTESECGVLRLRLRYDRATLALGVQPAARAVFWSLFFHDGDGWSGADLVRYTGRSRSAVFSALKRNLRAGYVEQKDGRYFISEMGRIALVRIHRETWRIATGRQVGFSPEVIRMFRDFGEIKVRPEASTISFKDNLPEIIDL